MESALTLNHFLAVSGILFAIGLAGVLVRRNLIVIFMCLELMLSAANLTLVAFSRHHVENGQPGYDGHVLLFFIITVAAAEVAVGLAIIVALFRSHQSTDVAHVDTMKH